MAAIAGAATCLIGGYEFIRSTSTSLFIEAYGSGGLPYAMTAVPLALGLLLYVYGRILSLLGARKALMATTLFSAGVFAAAFAALSVDFKPATALLYVYREAYIVVLVEQYWSLINSTLSADEAKIYNGPIIGCASIGPIIAGLLLNRYAQIFGTEAFLLLASASLLPAAFLSLTAYRLAGEPRPVGSQSRGGQGDLNLTLFKSSKTLVLLAAIVGLSQVLATMLSLRFYGLLEAGVAAKDARTAYLGGFWSTVNTASFILQFVFTPFVMRIARLRTIHLAIPAIHFAACLYLLLNPSLPAAAAALLLFKGMDYSFFRASKEILYIPLSFDARYRAKQVIDSFTYRLAKGGTAGALSVAGKMLGAVPGSLYAFAAAAAALAWAVCAAPLTDESKFRRST
jgi:AAA family ATP:ADP antiporter